MVITWQGAVCFILVLVIMCFIAGFIDVALEDRKRNREQAEREALNKRKEGRQNERTTQRTL